MKVLSVVLSCFLLLCLSSTGQAVEYKFQTFIFPNDTFTQLLGINSKQKISGYHGADVNKGFVLNAKTGKFKDENFPDSAQTQVITINNSEQTGGFYIDQAGITHGFIKSKNNKFTTVDFPGTFFNQILGSNNKNLAVGYWQDLNSGNDFPFVYVIKTNTFEQIILPSFSVSAQATGINDKGEICGFVIDEAGISHGFLLKNDRIRLIDFPESTFTQALGINNNGFVVGVYLDAAGNMHGFLYKKGTFQQIDDPNGVGTTTVNGINDQLEIVGFYVDSNGNTDGFLGKPIKK